MRFHACVGILPHERELPQPLELDLTVWLVDGAGTGGSVVDYRELYELAASAVARGPLRFLEDLADAVASAALARGDVERARVAARKPHVALPGPLDHAEIVLERTR
jgi:dihydroneopterin aldolase